MVVAALMCAHVACAFKAMMSDADVDRIAEQWQDEEEKKEIEAEREKVCVCVCVCVCVWVCAWSFRVGRLPWAPAMLSRGIIEGCPLAGGGKGCGGGIRARWEGACCC